MEETLSTTYFSALHDDAFSLLVEARNYIAALRQQGPAGGGSHTDQLDVTLETMRLTTRLTQVMAWVLAQKAVQNLELSAEEGASKRYRLSGQSICLDTEQEKAGNLPPQLRDLLQRSHALYCRVSRLEEQIGDRLASGETPLPTGEGPYLRPVTTSDQTPETAY